MSTVYQGILDICEKYLFGNSQKFLDRQISTHLKKSPENITAEDADELEKWSKVSGALLLGQSKAEQMAQEIFTLLKGNS